MVCSMDDKSMYGNEISRIGFGEAVEKNLLTDYKVLILAVGEKDITPWIQMVNPSVAEGQMVADELNVDIEDVLAALDEEESSRIDVYKRQEWTMCLPTAMPGDIWARVCRFLFHLQRTSVDRICLDTYQTACR